jgi:hypothetical protein
MVVTRDNRQGFISSRFAAIITDAPPAESQDKDIVRKDPADTVRVEITAYSLNVRSRPDICSEITGTTGTGSWL